jgi:hypothetical protein
MVTAQHYCFSTHQTWSYFPFKLSIFHTCLNWTILLQQTHKKSKDVSFGFKSQWCFLQIKTNSPVNVNRIVL